MFLDPGGLQTQSLVEDTCVKLVFADFVSLDHLGLQTQSLAMHLNLVSVDFLCLHAQVAHKSEKLHK